MKKNTKIIITNKTKDIKRMSLKESFTSKIECSINITPATSLAFELV